MSALTLTPRALYEEVAELLRQRIFSRELEAEDALAQQFRHLFVEGARGEGEGGHGWNVPQVGSLN